MMLDQTRSSSSPARPAVSPALSSPIWLSLARASSICSTWHPAPARNNEYVRLFRTDEEALKQQIIEEALAKDGEPTPSINKRIVTSSAVKLPCESSKLWNRRWAGLLLRVDLTTAMPSAASSTTFASDMGASMCCLHAGGLRIDRILPDKEPHQFDLVFDVKADGFFNLLKAAKGMPIGATVSFSSVAGRFGNDGQSDYSAANDLLCKISSSMRTAARNPRHRHRLDRLGQIGMASRGSVPQIMEALGVDMLPPEAACPPSAAS